MSNPGWFIVFFICITARKNTCLPHQTSRCVHPCTPCPLADKESEIPVCSDCNECAQYERSNCTGTMKKTTSRISFYCASYNPGIPTKCLCSTHPAMIAGILAALAVVVVTALVIHGFEKYKKITQPFKTERTDRDNSDKTANASVSAVSASGVQRERINSEVSHPLSAARDEGDNSDDETVKAAEENESDDATVKTAGGNDSAAHKAVSVAPCFQDEEKTSTTAPPDKTVDDPGITQEDFQQLKADLWTRHIAKDFASSLQSQISPCLLEIVATPTEQKQVEEESMNMAKFWIKQDSGVPYLQLRDLFVDYKEAQYISTARQRAKDPAFDQENCRE